MIVHTDNRITRKEYHAKRKLKKRTAKTTAFRKGTASAILAASLLAPANSAQAAGTKHYKVKQGDTLYNISKQAGVSLEALKLLNNKTDYLIWIGETILLPETAAKEPVSQYETRTVEPGDTWYKFSKETNVPIAQLLKLNKKTSDFLLVGESILLPSPETVKPGDAIDQSPKQKPSKPAEKEAAVEIFQVKRTVQQGESLWKIAREYRTTVDVLRETNNLKNNKIKPGQVLSIDGVSKATVTINGAADRNFVEFRLGSKKAIVLKVTPFFESDLFVPGDKAVILYRDTTKELIAVESPNK